MKDYNKIRELADEFGISTAETTIGMNGYPKGLNLVLTDFETITSLNEINEKLDRMLPYSECGVIELTRRDGQDLWNRAHSTACEGKYTMVGGSDWTIMFDPDEDNAEEVAFRIVVEGADIMGYDSLMLMCDLMGTFKEELESITEKSTVWYNPDNNYVIERIVTDESTGYSYDSRSTKLGIIIRFDEQDLVVSD